MKIKIQHNMNEQVTRLECAEQAWIDQYLFGELKAEELSRFETKLKNDPSFREMVELQKDIISGIFLFEGEQERKNLTISSDIKRKTRRPIINRILKLSAVIAILIASFFLLQKADTPSVQTTANLDSTGITYPMEWSFGDVDFSELAALNDIQLSMDYENVMLYWHFYEFHNAIPN